MFCKKCGYEIQEDSDRCPNCKCEINNIEEKNMYKEKIVKLIKENKKKVIAIVILCMVIIICIGIKVQKRCSIPKMFKYFY